MAPRRKGIKEIKQIIKRIPEEKQGIAKKLVDELLFMNESLDVLKKDIRERGPVVDFDQGKQHMVIENPSTKSYNTMVNRYATLFKQLNDLMPKEEPKVESDDFEDFVYSRD